MMKLANQSRMSRLSPKMRSKVGSIVRRSRRVSLTSKTINGRSDMVRLQFFGLGSDRLHFAAVDPKLGSSHPLCGGRHQKGHQLGNVVRLPVTADAGLPQQPLLGLID